MNTLELILSIEWYVNSKNLALKNSLNIRCPMNIEAQQEHRQYYSQYLAAILSITELLLDKSTPENESFRSKLYSILDSEHCSGENYYCYLRELRNSVVHRGGNITASAHVVNDFPLILSPTPITNRSGNLTYNAPERYFINIIILLEAKLPPQIINHIKECGWDKVCIDTESARADLEQQILESQAMPDWVKEQAVVAIQNIDLNEVQKEQIKSALRVIETTVTLPAIA